MARNRKLCPVTLRLLDSIHEAADMARRGVGESTFSALGAGAHLKPHCGSTNCRLTCHLPLIAPSGSSIRVGEEVRQVRAAPDRHPHPSRARILGRASVLLPTSHQQFAASHISSIALELGAWILSPTYYWTTSHLSSLGPSLPAGRLKLRANGPRVRLPSWQYVEGQPMVFDDSWEHEAHTVPRPPMCPVCIQSASSAQCTQCTH